MVKILRIVETKLKDVKIVYEEFIREHHEWREEIYSWNKYYQIGLKTLFTVEYITKVPFKNTLRGLYFQNLPLDQALLIKCIRGTILQAVVDIRPSSMQYGQGVIVELSENNLRTLYIPKGFAQGFLSLSDDVEILYRADNACSSDFENVLNYADPEVNLPWPKRDLIISIKDKNAPYLKNINCNYL